MDHPEAPPQISKIIEFVESQPVVDVWCKGCRMHRKMNGAYSRYIPNNEIESCRFCRDGGMES